MPGKKKGEKEAKATARRQKKEKRSNMGEDTDDFNQLNNQLLGLGLVLKQIPGDGNCLFRALGDQLTGHPQDHYKHREEVVRYMLDHRADFEPFVEDDISFDNHTRNLADIGTFGGNDSIVAFARLHNLTVVIHQLNKPLWQIHGGDNGSPGLKEAHISYHNGDHYNSVRRSGEIHCDGPAGIRLATLCKQHTHRLPEQNKQYAYHHSDESDESDYENYPSSSKLDRLVQEVSRLSGVSDEYLILPALEKHNFSVQVSVDELRNQDRVGQRRTSQRKHTAPPIWMENGTGSRIIGNQVGENFRPKPPNKNLTARRQKELKKREKRLERDKRGAKSPVREDLVSNLKLLTI